MTKIVLLTYQQEATDMPNKVFRKFLVKLFLFIVYTSSIAMGHLEIKGFEMHNGHMNEHGTEKSFMF